MRYSKHNIASMCICMGILIFELFDNTWLIDLTGEKQEFVYILRSFQLCITVYCCMITSGGSSHTLWRWLHFPFGKRRKQSPNIYQHEVRQDAKYIILPMETNRIWSKFLNRTQNLAIYPEQIFFIQACWCSCKLKVEIYLQQYVFF